MIRFIVLLLIVPLSGFAQIRLAKLEIPAKQVYRLNQSDIIVVDTLILRDSSRIELNQGKERNFIHAQHLVAGKGVRIVGVGTKGAPGKDGAKGSTIDGPCLDGTAGQNGSQGGNGQVGISLSIYSTTWDITGSLSIDLRGGDGGDGGKGGDGGGGSPGTRVCLGGTGGAGGIGAPGGNGGNGGTLTLACKNCPQIRMWIDDKLLIRNYGGFGGVGGEGGFGGLAGLNTSGDSSKDGKIGTKGRPGLNGIQGKQGAINFEKN